MAKKKSLYSQLDIDEIKTEIDRTVVILEKVVFENLKDDIEVKSSFNGASTPYIISSIEDKLASNMLLLEDVTEQLKSIHAIEGASEYLLSKIIIIQNKLQEIRSFYQNRPSEFEHRFKKHIVYKAKGPVELKLEAATKEKQEKTKSTIIKKMLKILPVLEDFKSDTERSILKGKLDIPTSLIGLL